MKNSFVMCVEYKEKKYFFRWNEKFHTLTSLTKSLNTSRRMHPPNAIELAHKKIEKIYGSLSSNSKM